MDERWFARLLTISQALGETYILLEPTPETLEERWREFEASGRRHDIVMFSEQVNTGLVARCQAQLGELRADIAAGEPAEIVRALYLDRIDELLANARMMTAAAARDADGFSAENLAMYGRPHPVIYEAACAWALSTAVVAAATLGPHGRGLGHKALDLLPGTNGDWRLLTPPEPVFRKVRGLHRAAGGYYDQLFGNGTFPTGSTIDQASGDEICRRVLGNIGSGYELADSANTIWAVSPSRRQLLRPAGYRLDTEEFIGIISHEAGSHILEAANGARSPLKLLQLGLAGYEKGNEGRAFLREQIVYDHELTFLRQFAWEYIVLLHLGASLASGSHDQPYGFARLYEVLETLYALWRELRRPGDPGNAEFARREAWYLTVRIAKGTDGQGGGYLKDIVYLEGNVRCWEVAASNPEAILHGDKGKFDITNARHVKALRELGIV